MSSASVPFDQLPLGELDPEPTAILEPIHLAGRIKVPPRVVICFFYEILEKRGNDTTSGWVEIGRRDTEGGPRVIWQVGDGDDAVAVLNPGTGGSSAAVMLEVCIAAGAETVVAVGGAGALVDELAMGNVVIPDRAVRDEGTSFHYLEPSRMVELNSSMVTALDQVLTDRNVPHQTATVWTTDGLFRETPDKVQRRRDEGCVLVDMECASMAAVCAFRGVRFGQFLYAGDSLASEDWDRRGWNEATDVREHLLDLAIDAARTV